MARRADTPCSLCGRLLFRGRSSLPPDRITCQKCRSTGVRRGPPKPRPRAVRPPRKSRKIRACEICGAEYSYTYSKQRTCGRACGLTLRLREPASPREPVATTCIVSYGECARCSNVFVSRTHRKYCGPDCRHAAQREADTLRNKQRSALLRQTQREGVCDHCSTPFRTNVGHRRYCTETCMKRGRRRDRDRAKRYEVEYEHVVRAKVYKRDRWRCGLCKGKVNPTLRYPHPMSVSLDHVVPMSRGGGHTYANVQCSHLSCNLDKSADAGPAQQLALVG